MVPDSDVAPDSVDSSVLLLEPIRSFTLTLVAPLSEVSPVTANSVVSPVTEDSELSVTPLAGLLVPSPVVCSVLPLISVEVSEIPLLESVESVDSVDEPAVSVLVSDPIKKF